ncbi:MAG: septal ring lytic transglycosylase RlpA family protein [Sphaerochaetaceae bacterium]|nr:septal ring lytic transglycosylase RlpA family protein [Sphaerochaetaceae bacterium]
MSAKRFMILLFLLLLTTGSLFANQREQGIASWYASEPGTLTANGEGFDPEAMTAAHKTLKFGTIVRVHNLEDNQTVDVRINDRGPFIENRIIDLTPSAAKALQMYEKGIIEVELEILAVPDIPESKYDRPGDTGWYRIQIGSFSNIQTAYSLYTTFHALGFKPTIEIVQDTLLRLTLRWIPSNDKDESLKIVKSLGFTDVLLRSEQNPKL